MKLFDLFGKKNVSEDIVKQSPYRISTELIPYKLYANKKSSSMLLVRLKNMTNESLMTSIVVEVPKQISLDEIGLMKAKELKLGLLNANEEKEAKFDLFSGPGTDKGEYTLSVTAFAHYRDYGHVLNAVKKRTPIEAL